MVHGVQRRRRQRALEELVQAIAADGGLEGDQRLGDLRQQQVEHEGHRQHDRKERDGGEDHGGRHAPVPQPGLQPALQGCEEHHQEAGQHRAQDQVADEPGASTAASAPPNSASSHFGRFEAQLILTANSRHRRVGSPWRSSMKWLAGTLRVGVDAQALVGPAHLDRIDVGAVAQAPEEHADVVADRRRGRRCSASPASGWRR